MSDRFVPIMPVLEEHCATPQCGDQPIDGVYRPCACDILAEGRGFPAFLEERRERPTHGLRGDMSGPAMPVFSGAKKEYTSTNQDGGITAQRHEGELPTERRRTLESQEVPLGSYGDGDGDISGPMMPVVGGKVVGATYDKQYVSNEQQGGVDATPHDKSEYYGPRAPEEGELATDRRTSLGSYGDVGHPMIRRKPSGNVSGPATPTPPMPNSYPVSVVVASLCAGSKNPTCGQDMSDVMQAFEANLSVNALARMVWDQGDVRLGSNDIFGLLGSGPSSSGENATGGSGGAAYVPDYVVFVVSAGQKAFEAFVSATNGCLHLFAAGMAANATSMVEIRALISSLTVPASYSDWMEISNQGMLSLQMVGGVWKWNGRGPSGPDAQWLASASHLWARALLSVRRACIAVLRRYLVGGGSTPPKSIPRDPIPSQRGGQITPGFTYVPQRGFDPGMRVGGATTPTAPASPGGITLPGTSPKIPYAPGTVFVPGATPGATPGTAPSDPGAGAGAGGAIPPSDGAGTGGATPGGPGPDVTVTPAGPPTPPAPAAAKSEGMSTGAKVGIGLGAIAILALALRGGK